MVVIIIIIIPLAEITEELLVAGSLTDFLAPPAFWWWPGEAFLNFDRWLLWRLLLLPDGLLLFLDDDGDCSGCCCKGQRSCSIRYASK